MASGKQKGKRTRRKRNKALCVNNNSIPESAGFKDTKENCIAVDNILLSELRSGLFHPHHILNHVKADLGGAKTLANELLREDVGVDYKPLLQAGMLWFDFKPWFESLQQFLKNMKRIPIYVRLGFAQCQGSALSAMGEKTPPKSVLRFLYFVVKHVVPLSLLGSKRNRALFMSSVKRLVFGARHQNITLSSVMHGLKVSEVPWLVKDIPSNCFRLYLLSCTVKWMLRWVQSLIGGLWYVTDTSPKAELVFYNKFVWQKIKSNSMREIISKKKLVLIPNDSSEIVAWGHLRFMPKSSGLRPITMLKVPEEKISKELISDAQVFLRQIACFMGCINMTFSPTVDEALQKALLGILSVHPNPDTRPSYYFVRVDIKDAFGSINLHKMLSIIKDAVKLTVPESLEVEVLYFKRRQRGRFDKLLPFKLFQTDKLITRVKENWIATGKQIESVSSLLQVIKAMILGLGVKNGGLSYKVQHGLPQGMALSTVLCEMYYASLDSKHLKTFRYCSQDEVFLRYCDDYLFLTPSRERAEKFLHTMEVGFPDYYCQINSGKSVSNLVNTKELYATFVGYSINIQTFCVEGNFSNFEGVNVGHTMNFCYCKTPGRSLMRRMPIVLKMKQILVDRRLNNKHTSLFNLYQVSLFSAFRFHAFVRFCFLPERINQKYLLRCVDVGVRQLTRFAYSFLSKTCAGKWISVNEVRWLAYQAFKARLIAVAAHYQRLIFWLRKRLEKLSKILTSVQLGVLTSVSTPALPGPFASMS